MLDECIYCYQMKGVLFVIDDSKNTQSPEMEKRTYTVDEIAKQLNISKKATYALVKSGQFSYVRAGRVIRLLRRDKLWLQ